MTPVDVALKTALEHCTCSDDYKRRNLEDPQCFSCNGGAELVEAVRAEFVLLLALPIDPEADALVDGLLAKARSAVGSQIR